MAFDTNRFTERSQQAISQAASLAAERGHAQIRPEHLLAALLADSEGIAVTTLERSGMSTADVRIATEAALERVPRVSGDAASPQLAPVARDVLVRSHDELAAFGDEYVSTEHLLLSLLQHGDAVAHILRDAGVTRESLLAALRKVRGAQRVTSQSPEGAFDALAKYAVDLSDLADRGKLDPVIGRDEEIRRVIQILSRRTKNNPVLLGEPGVGKTAILQKDWPGGSCAATYPKGLRTSECLRWTLGPCWPARSTGRVRRAAEGGPAGNRGRRWRDRAVHR